MVERREHVRMTRFLRERDPDSNARLRLGLTDAAHAELVRAINEQLDRAADEKREACLQKRQFQRDLASLSHDIRTPLAGAKGYLQLAAGEADAQQQAHCLRMAEARLDAMAEMLDQLFAYTRATDPDVRLDLQPVRLVVVLESVLAAHFPAFEERGWHPVIEVDDQGLTALADEEALRRVFENIIQNALRYGAGAPAVRADGCAIVFANPLQDGAMPDEARLFERFYRADVTRSTPGTGLGLATAKTLCDAMGMTLEAQVSPASFELRLRFTCL